MGCNLYRSSDWLLQIRCSYIHTSEAGVSSGHEKKLRKTLYATSVLVTWNPEKIFFGCGVKLWFLSVFLEELFVPTSRHGSRNYSLKLFLQWDRLEVRNCFLAVRMT